ncbi:MAG: hypothetical protein ACK5SQ_03260 [Chitinophagales bacterium]|jgi:hypothetical protein
MFDLDFSNPALSEVELLAHLTARIEEMLAHEPDLLMSLLYRNDVEEKAILAALQPSPNETVSMALARLVLERYKQRSASKKRVSIEQRDIPEGWEW